MIEVGQRVAQLRIVERIEAVFEETDVVVADAPRGVGGVWVHGGLEAVISDKLTSDK